MYFRISNIRSMAFSPRSITEELDSNKRQHQHNCEAIHLVELGCGRRRACCCSTSATIPAADAKSSSTATRPTTLSALIHRSGPSTMTRWMKSKAARAASRFETLERTNAKTIFHSVCELMTSRWFCTIRISPEIICSATGLATAGGRPPRRSNERYIWSCNLLGCGMCHRPRVSQVACHNLP